MLIAGVAQPLLDWGGARLTLDGSLVFPDTANRPGGVDRAPSCSRCSDRERSSSRLHAAVLHEAVEAVDSALVRERRQRVPATPGASARHPAADRRRLEGPLHPGVDDYLSVIDALQELRDVERDLIVEQRNLIAIRIDLFRALGGPCRRRMTRS